MYADGWKAVTDHVNQLTAAERDAIVGSSDFATDEWQLFDTRTDPTEATDLAASHPEKLAELVALWDDAAARNQVLPIDDSRDNRIAQMHLPWTTFRGTYHLRPGDKLHEANGPIIFGGFRMVALFDGPLAADATGVLCEQGDWIAGWAWFLAGGTATWIYTTSGTEHRISARLPAGCRSLAVAATPRPTGGVDLELSVDGEVSATATMDRAIPSAIAPDGAFLTVGYGRPFPVCDDYEPPCPAPSELVGVRIDVGPPPPLDLDAEFARVMRHQ